MNHDETAMVLKQLGLVFDREVTAELIHAYDRHLGNVNVLDTAVAVERIERTYDHFPYIADLLNEIRYARRDRERREERERSDAYYEEHERVDVPPPGVER